ncbi:MAG: polysaccharide lyase 6 family protein [Chitinophagaceae bacterium]|nr:polysaccharide lyase 6 family protein [Chitinophagaceae bacterium]
MLKLILLKCCLCIALLSGANTTIVKNAEELKKANKEASPGDIIILQDGIWNNITISLNCTGTKEQPITFKAQTAGKVIISGNSKLLIGGTYIIVDGFYFTNGYAGSDAIIKFRVNNEQLANYCRVTNTVINNFNNPQRMDDNYWVALYGKHNQIDHCRFQDKKNMGVMMAVLLDDERSRENFHSINNNYFGFRLPLASNSGETIRVGVSQHCEFNSNTQIIDNFFEHCDGETEIISLKSCSNVIRNNLFKECSGAVVLRHGNYNTMESNVFLGNNKPGTGGVRIINKGQWVVNNLFYECRGKDFRSPIAIMNGVPNSPANRYVEVTDAVIANNSFYNCTPLSFCDGSDAERSVTPSNVAFINNIYYNNTDKIAYLKHDDISRIRFAGNIINDAMPQTMPAGFNKSTLSIKKEGSAIIPVSNNSGFAISDSLKAIGSTRLAGKLSSTPGITDIEKFKQVIANAETKCGAAWFNESFTALEQTRIRVTCKTADDVYKALQENKTGSVEIILTKKKYQFPTPIILNANVTISARSRRTIKFNTTFSDFLFYITAGNNIILKKLRIDMDDVETKSFISSDTSGSSNHSNLIVTDCVFKRGKMLFFNAAKTTVLDSIIITNNTFTDNKGMLFNFSNELDKKGYYNVEKLIIANNTITEHKGQILAMQRTGNDESTMGPNLTFSNNKLTDCKSDEPLIHLYGTQVSSIANNSFTNCNAGKTLILFEDIVRAAHSFRTNLITNSGKVVEDPFVVSEGNVVR